MVEFFAAGSIDNGAEDRIYLSEGCLGCALGRLSSESLGCLGAISSFSTVGIILTTRRRWLVTAFAVWGRENGLPAMFAQVIYTLEALSEAKGVTLVLSAIRGTIIAQALSKHYRCRYWEVRDLRNKIGGFLIKDCINTIYDIFVRDKDEVLGDIVKVETIDETEQRSKRI